MNIPKSKPERLFLIRIKRWTGNRQTGALACALEVLDVRGNGGVVRLGNMVGGKSPVHALTRLQLDKKSAKELS